MAEKKKWIVTFTLTPTNYNKPESKVVEAASERDAQAIVRDLIRDFSGSYVYKVTPYEPPPPGRVIDPMDLEMRERVRVPGVDMKKSEQTYGVMDDSGYSQLEDRSASERMDLVCRVSKWIYDNTDSLEGRLGMQLAYLYPAIARAHKVECDPGSHLVELLRGRYSDACPHQEVWEYIDVLTEDGQGG